MVLDAQYKIVLHRGARRQVVYEMRIEIGVDLVEHHKMRLGVS